jgi:hypothetical protein
VGLAGGVGGVVLGVRDRERVVVFVFLVPTLHADGVAGRMMGMLSCDAGWHVEGELGVVRRRVAYAPVPLDAVKNQKTVEHDRRASMEQSSCLGWDACCGVSLSVVVCAQRGRRRATARVP